MSVRWEPISGWPGYSVSDTGLVWSESRKARHPRGESKAIRGRMLKRCTNSSGYPVVTLSREGKTKTRAVHVLVLEAFVGPCPAGQECRHMDGDKGNACLDNLQWGTPAANAADKDAHGTQVRGERHGAAKVTATQAHRIQADPRSQSTIAADNLVSQTTVSNIKLGRHWAVRQRQGDAS